MLASSDIEAEKETDALVALDKLDKIGENGVSKEMLDRGIPEVSAQTDLGFIGETNLRKDNSEIVAALANFTGDNESGRVGCNDLDEITSS